MATIEFLRGTRPELQPLASARSNFQGRLLSGIRHARLARRMARLGLTPLAVAEVSSDVEQRGT
jgi:hypothetical protein